MQSYFFFSAAAGRVPKAAAQICGAAIPLVKSTYVYLGSNISIRISLQQIRISFSTPASSALTKSIVKWGSIRAKGASNVQLLLNEGDHLNNSEVFPHTETSDRGLFRTAFANLGLVILSMNAPVGERGRFLRNFFGTPYEFEATILKSLRYFMRNFTWSYLQTINR